MELDSIFALSSPVGGAVALIRASGPDCARIAEVLTGRALMQTPRYMAHVALAYEGTRLDDAMAACFTAPQSYTGEDMLELYCHGSPAAARAVCSALAALGLRPAEPGEFTRRAFLNGKMDLSQAEAVMDLIQAQASLSAKAALEQMRGRLSAEVETVETLLYDALSAVSAAIDYPEELDEDVFYALPQKLGEAKGRLAALLAEGMRGRVLREGFRVVLLGAPNAGKSSLLNALLGYERAIVTQEAGTTRDTLEETLLFEGVPFVFTDTAGLRQTQNEAERLGVARAREAARGADAALLLLDGANALPEDIASLQEEVQGMPALLLRTKADLPAVWEWDKYPLPMLDISVKTREGIPALLRTLRELVGAVGDAYVTNQRHIHALECALLAVVQAQAAQDADCAATDMRDALVHLGAITGRAVDDTVISEIFARFCVGK